MSKVATMVGGTMPSLTPNPKISVSLIPRNCQPAYMARGIKVADGIKAANQLTLK